MRRSTPLLLLAMIMALPAASAAPPDPGQHTPRATTDTPLAAAVAVVTPNEKVMISDSIAPPLVARDSIGTTLASLPAPASVARSRAVQASRSTRAVSTPDVAASVRRLRWVNRAMRDSIEARPSMTAAIAFGDALRPGHPRRC